MTLNAPLSRAWSTTRRWCGLMGAAPGAGSAAAGRLGVERCHERWEGTRLETILRAGAATCHNTAPDQHVVSNRAHRRRKGYFVVVPEDVFDHARDWQTRRPTTRCRTSRSHQDRAVTTLNGNRTIC